MFDERRPPTAEPDHDRAGVGMWSLVHSLYVQCGYDWYEENDASLRALENRVKSVVMYRGEAAAREEYERILAEMSDFESELDAWLDDHPTGEASI